MRDLGIKSPKRVIFVLLAAVAAFMLTACGASVTVYDYFGSDGQRYNAYELAFDADTVRNAESTAAFAADGKRYTLASYLNELFDDFGYEFDGAQSVAGGYTVRYRKAVNNDGELYRAGSAVEFKRTYTENPFVRTYTEVSPNPFNGVRETYDNIEPTHSSTILERLKNGAIAFDEFGEPTIGQPAIDVAFPYLKGADLDGLPLRYVRYGTERMSSSGTSTNVGDNAAAYVFTRYFDNTDTEIAFEFKRAVPYGWYMTAIVAGAIVLTVFVLVTRTKKQKPTLLDRFPYDPEEYRDYESRLPLNMN